jgi:hypothetical protein
VASFDVGLLVWLLGTIGTVIAAMNSSVVMQLQFLLWLLQ